MILWILYAFSFLLHWYENLTIVRPVARRPLIFSQVPYFQALLFVCRLICQYGSIIGIGYSHDLFTGFVALIISYLFGKITFKVYFNKEVNLTVGSGVGREQAREWVLRNIKTGGRWV